MPLLNKLTKKQRGFVKDYVKTENGTQAVMNNYDVKDSTVAKSIASENLTKPYVLEAVNLLKKSLADRIPDELLEQVHLDGLSAVSEDMPDYSVRHKYLDSAYKLKGSYAPEKTTSLNLNLEARNIANPELETIRQDFINKLKEKLACQNQSSLI